MIEEIAKKIGFIPTMIIVSVVVFALAVGGWFIKREFNYSFNYESQVKETIKAEIKPLENRIKQLEKEIKELKERK